MSGLIKYRVHEVAKDFNMTSKEITQILTDYATTPKNHMQVLEDDENIEYNMTFLGIVGMIDPPRKAAQLQQPTHSRSTDAAADLHNVCVFS